MSRLDCTDTEHGWLHQAFELKSERYWKTEYCDKINDLIEVLYVKVGKAYRCDDCGTLIMKEEPEERKVIGADGKPITHRKE